MENRVEDQMQVCPDLQRRKRKRRPLCDATVEDTWELVGSTGTADVDDESEEPATKYREIEAHTQFQLEQFSDEMLCEIFKHLDSWALLALNKCCKRFHVLIQDHRFWRHIDLGKESLPLAELEEVLKRIHANTHCIKFQSQPTAWLRVLTLTQTEFNDCNVVFNRALLYAFTKCCTQLRVLELQGVPLDFEIIRIVDFPATLKRLILDNCSVRVTNKSLFSGIEGRLTELEELGIENSDWFEPYYIMVFSKLPALRWLSLKGCPNLLEFVPYGSMSARFGFRTLEYLDLRFTPITDSDLQCFNAVLTLKEILLDCPQRLIPLDAGDSAEDVASEASTSKWARIADDASEDGDSPSTSTAAVATPSTSGNRRSNSNSNGSSPIVITNNTNANNNSNNCSAINNHNNHNNTNNSNNNESNTAHQPSTSAAAANAPLSVSVSIKASTSSPLSSSSSSSSSSPSSSPISSPSSPHFQPGAIVEIGTRPCLVPGGNAPPRSRFLPRPSDVIYVGFQNLRRPLQPVPHGQPTRRQPNNQLDHVLNHPLFWDIMNPFALPRNNDPSIEASPRDLLQTRRCVYSRRCGALRTPISDRSICCFGRPRNPVEMGVIWIHVGNRPSENSFRRLSVRNYKSVTDISLEHLKQCSPHLVFLDLSGTSVTQDGVKNFKASKPECQIVADHLRAQ